MSASCEDLRTHTDEELISLCQAGDEHACDTLVRRHIGGIYELCLDMLRSPTEAEDATQETLVAAFQNLDTFRGDAAFKSWLYRIARNKALDLGRRKNVRTTTSFLAAQVEPGAGLQGAWTDPEQVVLRQSEAERLWGLVAELPMNYRLVVYLFYRQGLSHEEIAEALGVPKRTVETRLYRARKRLRDMWHRDKTGGERV
jgi:RNA polymerase sigma-70 factor (ECF subfamily)